MEGSRLDSAHVDPLRPFGDPDGSRTDIDDVMRGFVGFDEHPVFGGLAVSNTEAATRVLVGRKGAGKSRYLRRFAAGVKDAASVYTPEHPLPYTDSVQKDAPSTTAVIKVSHSVKEPVLTERWQLIWRRAIFRALVSHILCSDELKAHLDEEEHRELRDDYSSLYRTFKSPLSIYSQVGEIINEHTRSSMEGYLEGKKWNDLEAVIARIVRRLPPLYFFIDAIDDEYAHAPSYWLRCQKGLFYTVMKLAKDDLFGSRLHILICIRDHVFSSVLRSEHGSRYRDSPNIRPLMWNAPALRVFMREKLRGLPDALFVRPEMREDHPVAAWLGSEEIWNEDREIMEDIETYILRHSRLSPRDIVQFGNRASERIVSCAVRGEEFSADAVRLIVQQLASEWGNEQLTVCAQQMSADMMPPHAADHDYAEVFTGALEYAPVISQTLRSFILEAISDDHFDREAFEYAREVAAERFDERIDVFSVLWQNGLLGYGRGTPEPHNEHFYSIREHADSFLVPEDCDFYVLHSSLIDAIGVTPVGGQPVLGFHSG